MRIFFTTGLLLLLLLLLLMLFKYLLIATVVCDEALEGGVNGLVAPGLLQTAAKYY